MKLIIAGSRHISVSFDEMDAHILDIVEKMGQKVTGIISGGAKGVDTSAREYVYELAKFGGNWNDFFHEELPNWDKHGKAAGPLRNRRMAEMGDVLLVIWDGKSRGSRSMKNAMEELDKPIFQVIKENPRS